MELSECTDELELADETDERAVVTDWTNPFERADEAEWEDEFK
jgi:hypothetical protein